MGALSRYYHLFNQNFTGQCDINRVPARFMLRLYTTLHGLCAMMTKQILYDLSTDPLSYLSITDCQSVENLGLQVHVRIGRPFYV